jgi:uncharacterized membrane protein
MMKAIQLTGGGTDLPRHAAELDRAGGAAGSRLVRIGAAAGILFVLLALGGAALSRSDALREAGALLNAAAPLLMILWITGAWRLQLRLSAWRGPAAWRWQAVAYGLWVASFLALMGFVAGSTIAGRSLGALFGTPWGVPAKTAVVSFAASTLLYAVVAMRAGVLPAGAMALWAIGAIQSIFDAPPSDLLVILGLVWGSAALWRKAASREARPAEQAVAAQAADQRLLALDALRGLIMVLMAIDHMRMVLMPHPLEIWDAALPQYDSAGPFLTRFVTHFCAPGFFLLTGAGMILFADVRGKAGWSQAKIARHWILRGLLLVVVDQLVINPVLNGRPTPLIHQVLTGLGGAMIIGALLFRLRARPLLALGAGIVLVNQVLPAALVAWQVPLTPLIRFLLVPGASGPWFFVYSAFGWLGVTVLGMALGRAWLVHGSRVFRWTLIGGLLVLPLFVLVRLGGGFGNIRPIEGSGWIGFLNVVKYPPSLALLLITLGVSGILLYLFDRAGPALARWGRPLLVFGQVALFFYVTHIFLYKVLQIMWADGKGLTGVNLPTMYLGWAAGLLLLYPICLIYGQFKRMTPPGSLWRLF